MPPRTIAEAARGGVSLQAYQDGPLGDFLAAGSVFDVSTNPHLLPDTDSQSVLFAPWLLQDVGDYRGALQRWFACLTVGGLLVVTVPHAFLYERQDAAPSRRRSAQRRLYSPRALIEEIEEALAPNSYRLRWLGDLDQGYDYAAAAPSGRHDVAAVIVNAVNGDFDRNALIDDLAGALERCLNGELDFSTEQDADDALRRAGERRKR